MRPSDPTQPFHPPVSDKSFDESGRAGPDRHGRSSSNDGLGSRCVGDVAAPDRSDVRIRDREVAWVPTLDQGSPITPRWFDREESVPPSA